MIDQAGRLPLAEYLRVLDLARHLDPNIVEDISIESVEEAIKRQLGSILPAFHTRVGFKSYEDLKQEEEVISRILDIIEAEIRPLASEFTPSFVDHLQ